MTNKLARKKVIILYIVLAVVLLLVGSLFLAYGTNSTDSISLFFKKFYPAIVVGGSPISIYDKDKDLEIAKKLDPTMDQTAATDQLIQNKKMENLVSSSEFSNNWNLLDQEYRYYTGGKTEEYQQLLKTYFSNDEGLFIKFVLLPKFDDARLRIKYNSDLKANASAYAKAQDILKRINNGEKFEDLAKLSDDQITSQTGGDLGLVTEDEVFPEFFNALESAKVGEVSKNILISREGYHIIYPVETITQNGQKLWHIKHISVATTGFQNWLDAQLAKVSVWHIK
ncbi:MAG TPA: peptidylprolyl isomerase [Methylomirabilota bacterium]|nr:peptidylprolyl isomerase [Methylomirabilota bacterium]